MDSRAGSVASYIEKNYSVILATAEKVWDEIKDILNSYSLEEVRIINQVQAIVCKDVKPENYPIHLKYSASSTATRKFPAYILPNEKLELDQSRIGNNKLVPQFTAIIEDLINCYNSRREKWFASNSKAINHIFLYLIDIMYFFSSARLNDIGMLEELDLHIGFIEKIMTIDEIKNKFFDTKNEDAKKALSKALFILLDQCKPLIIDIRKKRSAAELLDQMTDATTNLCHAGFNLALHIVSKEKVSTAVSLVNISREKKRDNGSEEVRRFAIHPIDQNIKFEPNSLQWFMYNFSGSLISRLENVNLKTSGYKPYVKQDLVAAILADKNDFYSPLKKKNFLEYYLDFCSDLEKFSELSKLIELAKTTCDGRGDLFYFVIANHASKTLLIQINTILSSFTAAYENLLNIARLQNLANSDAVETEENNSWQQSYNTVIMKDAPAINIHIKKIKELCKELEKLHSDFSQDPMAKIKDIYDQSNTFRSKIYNFQNSLIEQKYHKANELFIIPAVNPIFIDCLESIPSLDAQAQIRKPVSVSSVPFETGLKVIDSPLEEKISLHKEEFKKMLSKLEFSKFSEIFEKYATSEKHFVKIMERKEIDSKVYKHEYKECYQHYCVLDDWLKKFRLSHSLSLENKKSILEFQIELALRQANYLVNLVIQRKSTPHDLRGSMDRFSKKCLAVENEKLGDSNVEMNYKNLMKKIQRNLDVKTSMPDDAALLSLLPVVPKIPVEEKQDIFSQPAVNPSVSASQQGFFSNKCETIVNKSIILTDDSNINSRKKSLDCNKDKGEVVITSQKEIKTEPKLEILSFDTQVSISTNTNSPTLDEGEIYDPKISNIKLKSDINAALLPTIGRMVYAALIESALEANSGYNGWNFPWSYTKTENEKRHKDFREHYQTLLQYAASAYPYLVVDNPLADKYISAERMLQWIEKVVENEKKYWGQYSLYARLKEIAEGLRVFVSFRNPEIEKLTRIIAKLSQKQEYGIKKTYDQSNELSNLKPSPMDQKTNSTNVAERKTALAKLNNEGKEKEVIRFHIVNSANDQNENVLRSLRRM